jgi:uncharacterized membrane protein
MLETLSRLALRLQPLTRALFIGLVLLTAATAVIIALPSVSSAQDALPALLAVVLWLLCLLVFIQTFATVPARPGPEMSGLRRLARLLNRGFHWLLFVLFVAISLAALSITGRLLVEL